MKPLNDLKESCSEWVSGALGFCNSVWKKKIAKVAGRGLHKWYVAM